MALDGGINNEKKTRNLQKKIKWAKCKKNWNENVGMDGKQIYIDGLFEYVSNGCEENVVLNLVITF